MKKNSILLEKLSSKQLTELMKGVLTEALDVFKNELNAQSEKDDLMTRDQVLELLQINPSTLWHWQNKGRITVFKYSNKCYYKRSQIMAALTPLNK